MISYEAGSSPSPPNEGRGDAETDCLDIFQIAQCSPSRPGPSPRDSCTQGTLLTEISTGPCRPVYGATTLFPSVLGVPFPRPSLQNCIAVLAGEAEHRMSSQMPLLSKHLKGNQRALKL